MTQEEQEMLKSAKREGAKTELEMEKIQYMLSNTQHMLLRRKEDAPELYDMLDLFRIWTEIRDVRKQLETMNGHIVNLRRYQAFLEKTILSIREETRTYPGYPKISRIVADSGREDGEQPFRDHQNIT